jgi:hypothetical protein
MLHDRSTAYETLSQTIFRLVPSLSFWTIAALLPSIRHNTGRKPFTHAYAHTRLLTYTEYMRHNPHVQA